MALNFGNIETEVASILRLDLNVATQKTLVDRWINDAIQDIHGRHDWNWTLDRQTVQTVADKTAGTVAVAASGTTVTGTSTAFSSTDIGSFIQFSSSNDWYKVTAVASTVSLTIEKAYTQSTAATADTYILRKVYYSLPNAEKFLSIKEANTPNIITPVHFRQMDEHLPFPTGTGEPNRYFVYGVDASGDLRFSLYPFPDSVMNIEVRYKKKATELSASTDSPEIPEPWRFVLIDGALARGYEYVALGAKTEFGHQAVVLKRQTYEQGIARMIYDSEPMQDYQPRLMSAEASMLQVGPVIDKSGIAS